MNCLQSEDKYYIENELNTVKKIKVLLYNEFYNKTNMDKLLEIINNNFNLFNIECENNQIRLKIKKTDMKKSSSYQCTPHYYYKVLNDIFYIFFNSNIEIINNLIINKRNQYNLYGDEIKYFKDINKIYLFYNITIILDNIITIYL